MFFGRQTFKLPPGVVTGAILEHVTENPRLAPWAPLQKLRNTSKGPGSSVGRAED